MVNVYEAKTQLSKLLDLAAKGSETIIAKSGKPVAKLVPYREDRIKTLGLLKGRIWIADDFDEFAAQDYLDWYSE